MLALIIGMTLMSHAFRSALVTTPLFGEPTTELFRLLAPAFVIAGVGIVPLAMLERRLDFRRISMIEISGVLVGAVTSVGLALAGLNAEAYVLGTVSRASSPGLGCSSSSDLASCRAGARVSCARSRDSGSPPGPRAWRWSATANRLPDSRREAESGAGRLLLPRLFARGPVRDQDQQHRLPDRVPDLLADGGPRAHASPALAGHPDQRGRDLPAAGAVHRHRPAAGALALRPTVGPGRGAGADPHGRRDGADDQQRDALAGARGR